MYSLALNEATEGSAAKAQTKAFRLRAGRTPALPPLPPPLRFGGAARRYGMLRDPLNARNISL
jgi:hypothetical protein